MAVKRCSKAGVAGWHNALQNKWAETTWLDHFASEKRSPLSSQNTLLACLHMYLLGDQWSALID